MTEISTSLADVPVGTRATLALCSAEPQLRARLATLGLRCGARVEVMRRTSGGGRILGVAGARIALDPSVLRTLLIKDDA